MKTKPEAIVQIEAALAAGPTDGPWFLRRTPNDDGTVDLETGRIAQSEWPPAQNCEYGTAEYIVACNPAAMREVLDHIDAQDAEIARLRDASEDPLQGAVDWLLEADRDFLCVATVQRTLRIGYNRAQRLCNKAKESAALTTKGTT